MGQELSFRTLDQGDYSLIGRATNLVLRTQADWEELWKRHQGTVDRPAPVPAVDFNEEMVLGVMMGLKPTGGYVIKITRIESTPASLKVFVLEHTPGPDDYVGQAFTVPFHFVAVAKSELKPEFSAAPSN